MTPCSIEGVKERLGSISKKPTKSLGQNFLIDRALRDEILARADIKGAPVLEIGPGLGAFTEGLLDGGAGKIVAVEKDAILCDLLKKEYGDRITLINGDILRVSLDEAEDAPGEGFYVVGSLPYYITSPIILRLLGCGKRISGMTLIVQQEAAERFFASPGDEAYGPLTVAAGLMYGAERGAGLAPDSFFPRPNVRSVAVHLTRYTEQVNAGLVPFLKKAFAMRRKTLINNLMASGYTREKIKDVLNELGIREDVRAEAIGAKEMHEIFIKIKNTDSRA